MRRRFGRRRGRSSAAGRGTPIDAARWLTRIIEDGVVAASRLEPLEEPGVPDHFAAVGRGEAQDGTPLVVAFAPRSGGDAVLAALALASRVAAEADGSEGTDESAPTSPATATGFAGEVIAVAPQWSTAARRRLGQLGELPFRFRAIAASSLSDGDVSVEPEPAEDLPALSPQQVAAHLSREADRGLFERAAAALEGLASKHGGAVRGVGRSVELVLLGRRAAELRADDGGVLLNTILPQRSSVRLSGDDLAGALDRLEGNLRRRLTDRRAKEGEEGLRTRAIPLVAESAGLRGLVRWPLGGSDNEALDLVGVDAEGRAVVGASREELSLSALGAVLDALATLRPVLPHLLAPAGPPLRLDAPRLVLAARQFELAVTRVLPLLDIGFELLEIRSGRDGELSVAQVAAGEAPTRTRGRGRPRRSAPAEPAGAEAEGDGEATESESAPAEARSGNGRGRRRRGGRRRGGRSGDGRESADAAESEAGGSADEPSEAAAAESDDGGRPRYDEVSLFDLDDDRDDEDGGRRRRGRGRRRGRRGSGERDRDDAGDGDDATSPDASAEGEREPRGRGRGRGRRRRRDGADRSDSERSDAEPSAAETDDDADAPEDLSEMVSDLPMEALEPEDEPRYEDDDDLGEETSEADRLVLERERRRRARQAKAQPEPEAEKPRPVRRRAAIVAHADRDSVLSATLLARDVRLLEGFWVYPQEELMTFFRSVATDLKEGTPIHVVGFTPRPARDVIQAVSLYGDRVFWYDHHVWPPEDALSLRQTIGEDNLHLTPQTGSSLPGVLATSTRRSRFSDKLVDLGTGRFTQHDYERWGRLWWWRLGEIAGRPGERRQDIDALLAGRPSDLAKEASRADTPPLPPELGFVAGRDFRLVHFAGFSMVVVEVPEELDPLLTSRIARERYDARLSLAVLPGGETLLLAGEELGGRRSLDFGSMVDHLASKLDWVDGLSDDDHVARFSVRGGAPAGSDRLDEVVAEIAMGSSILDG